MKLLIKFIKNRVQKLSLIDYVALLIVGILLLFAVFWFSRTKQQVVLNLVAKSSYYSGGPPPEYWVTNSIHQNDQIFNEFGQLVGSVQEVENVDFGGPHRFLRVTVQLDSLLDSRTKLYKYGNQRLKIGDDLTLTIKNVHFIGTIQRIRAVGETDSLVQKKMKIKVYSRNIPLWLVNTYNDSFKVFDREGHQIFHILKVTSIKPSTEEVAKVEDGTIKIVENELYRNVEMEVEVMTKCDNNVCYFNDQQPIKLNEQIWIQNDDSSVPNAIVTGILSEEVIGN